ncbi:MAG: RNA polymerase sigma factor, partial [Planctomycetota bacterium]
AGVPAAAWLAGFVRNAARGRRRTEARRRARERGAARSEALPSAADDAARLEIHRALLDGVEALPEAQRRAIVARFLEGHPPRRIARDEGVPVATVHSRIQRGLERLRTDLDAAHGDRRAWAAWIAPVAGAPGWTRASIAGAFAGAAALIAAVAVATVTLREPTKPLPPTSTVAGDDAAPVAAAPVAGAADEVAALPEEEPTTRAAASSEPIVVRVLREDGAPAADVEVLALSAADLSGRTDLEALAMSSPEGLLHDHGRRLVTDDEGAVEVDLTPPVALWAGDGTSAVQSAVESGTREVLLTLARAPRLTVRVLDDAGEPIESGIDVGLRAQASWTGSEGESERQHRALVGGRAFFQDVGSYLVYTTAEGEEVRRRARLVHVDLPGCAESGRGAKKLSFRFGGRVGKPRTVDLTIPPLGSVQIVVRRGGGIAPVDGSVRLRFPAGDASGGNPIDYYAKLEGGIAVFPRFAAGAGPFRAQVSVPSLGAVWRVEGAGPAEAGERIRLSTEVPVGKRVTVTALGEDGAPLANTALRLWLGVMETGGAYSSLGGRTDGSGQAVFTLGERDRRLFPMRIEAFGSSGRQWTLATALFESGETRSDGVDLGEITLRFRAPQRVFGRLEDPNGRPLGKEWIRVVGADRRGSMLETRRDGTFETRQVVRDVARIFIENSDSWRDSVTVVAVDDLDEPIVVVARPSSSLEAHLDLSPFRFERSPMRLVLRDASGEVVGTGFADTSGHVVVEGLEPGTFDVAVHMRGNVALTTIPGVAIADGDVARDPRIDAFRLRDHVREIEVASTGLPRRQTPQMAADALAGGAKPSVHRTSAGESFLVPLHVPCRLTFTAPPKAPVVVADSTTIEDRVEIAFADPKRATFRLTGAISPNETVTLIGVNGTPTQRCSISVDPAGADGGRLTVDLPAEGLYRVARGRRPAPEGGGMMSMAMPEPTEALVEITADATVDVPVDAPSLPR